MKSLYTYFKRVRSHLTTAVFFVKKMHSHFALLLIFLAFGIFTTTMLESPHFINPISITALRDLCVAVAALIVYKIVREAKYAMEWNPTTARRCKIVFIVVITCILLIEPICWIIGMVSGVPRALSPLAQALISYTNCVFLGAFFSLVDSAVKQ